MRNRRCGLVWATGLVAVGVLGALGAGCAESHGFGSDQGGTDQSFRFDGDTLDQGLDGGRLCEGQSPSERPAGDPAPAPPFIPPNPPCRTSIDCSGGMQCFSASDGFCGICQPPERECEEDTDCGLGMWCRSGQPDCCAGISTTCMPACTTDGGSCEEGEICDADTGRCGRFGCTFLDLACPENHDCDPERLDGDALGCARRACNVDGDCDCGFCVTGTCEAALGTCSFPPP